MRQFLILLLLPALAMALSSNYDHSVEVNPGYTLSWKIDGDKMRLAIQADTTGWVAFGLAEYAAGSMAGSDMVIVSFTDGVATASDRYAMGKITPNVDTCQDWEVVAGSTTTESMEVELVRSIDTGEDQDRAFIVDANHDEANMAVVIAWGLGEFGYHSENRFATRINFADPNAPDILADLKADPSVMMMNVRSVNLIKSYETEYINVYRPISQYTPQQLCLDGMEDYGGGMVNIEGVDTQCSLALEYCRAQWDDCLALAFGSIELLRAYWSGTECCVAEPEDEDGASSAGEATIDYTATLCPVGTRQLEEFYDAASNTTLCRNLTTPNDCGEFCESARHMAGASVCCQILEEPNILCPTGYEYNENNTWADTNGTVITCRESFEKCTYNIEECGGTVASAQTALTLGGCCVAVETETETGTGDDEACPIWSTWMTACGLGDESACSAVITDGEKAVVCEEYHTIDACYESVQASGAIRAAGYDAMCDPLKGTSTSEIMVDIQGDPSKLYHIIGFEHFITPGLGRHVHHMTLNAATRTGEEFLIFAWALGTGPLRLPDECGFKLGGEDGVVYFIMNMHYDNPGGVNVGKMDTSGIRIYYSESIREHECGAINVGDPSVNMVGQYIAAGYTKHTFDCPAECMATFFPETAYVFAGGLHMHTAGKRVWLDLYRDGEFLEETMRNDFWDHAFEFLNYVSFEVGPNDLLRTECIEYASSDKSVKWGQASGDEMCMAFLYYWPKVHHAYKCGMGHCGSMVATNVPADGDEGRPVSFGSAVSQDQCQFDAAMCSTMTCPSTYQQVAGASTVECPYGECTEEQCCELRCDANHCSGCSDEVCNGVTGCVVGTNATGCMAEIKVSVSTSFTDLSVDTWNANKAEYDAAYVAGLAASLDAAVADFGEVTVVAGSTVASAEYTSASSADAVATTAASVAFGDVLENATFTAPTAAVVCSSTSCRGCSSLAKCGGYDECSWNSGSGVCELVVCDVLTCSSCSSVDMCNHASFADLCVYNDVTKTCGADLFLHSSSNRGAVYSAGIILFVTLLAFFGSF